MDNNSIIDYCTKYNNQNTENKFIIEAVIKIEKEDLCIVHRSSLEETIAYSMGIPITNMIIYPHFKESFNLKDVINMGDISVLKLLFSDTIFMSKEYEEIIYSNRLNFLNSRNNIIRAIKNNLDNISKTLDTQFQYNAVLSCFLFLNYFRTNKFSFNLSEEEKYLLDLFNNTVTKDRFLYSLSESYLNKYIDSSESDTIPPINTIFNKSLLREKLIELYLSDFKVV